MFENLSTGHNTQNRLIKRCFAPGTILAEQKWFHSKTIAEFRRRNQQGRWRGDFCRVERKSLLIFAQH